MKIRALMLGMMTLLLSAGPLMAMDSEYQEKRRKALETEGDSPVTQEGGPMERSRERDATELRLPAGDEWEQTREALRYWWQ